MPLRQHFFFAAQTTLVAQTHLNSIRWAIWAIWAVIRKCRRTYRSVAYAGIRSGKEESLLPAQLTMVPSHVHSGGHSASMIQAPASFVRNSSDPTTQNSKFGCVCYFFSERAC